MNWDAIGAIAELLASITVIVTLIYLATQVRQANTNLHIAATQAMADFQTAWLRSLRSDEKLYSIYRQGLKDREALSPVDRGRFDLLLLEMLNHVDSAYHQYRAGAMNEDQWQSLVRSFRTAVDFPGAYASWQLQKAICTDVFRDYIDELYSDRKQSD
ncbi:MAG: hypothetical protein JKY48_12625 [Flavobacteriales bacterium]|nr:hypothetical protein [Flavobacteriales bacterium]